MRFYRKGLPWAHGLGTPVKGCTTSQEVMETAKLDWHVDKCKLVARMPFRLGKDYSDVTEDGNIRDGFAYGGDIYRDVDGAYATYRTDLNIPLGLVKSKYHVVQNEDAFAFFDEVVGKDQAQYQYAGAFGQGHKIFVTAKIPVETRVDKDPINNYLVFSNNHDGGGSVSIMFTPIRVFCTNCLTFGTNKADSYIRIKHTESAKEKLDNGARILKIACEYAISAQDVYQALYKVNIKDEQVLEYICGLILSADEYIKVMQYDAKRGFEKIRQVNFMALEATGISTRKANQIATMYDYYFNGVAQQEIVGNLWGAYNCVTGYWSNVANLEGEKRMDSLLYGNAQNVMFNAFNKAVDIMKEAV